MTSSLIIFILAILLVALSLGLSLLLWELSLIKKSLVVIAKGDFVYNDWLVFLRRPFNFMVASLKEQASSQKADCKVFVDDSTHKAILNVLDDVESVKKELESERFKFGLVLENLGDAVVVLGAKGDIIYFNPLMDKLFKEKKVRKKTNFSLLINEINPNIDIASRLTEVVAKGITFETELVLYPGHENEQYIRAIMAPLRFPGGGIEGVVGVFHDITEIRKLDRLKYDFIATISHELRTPLTVIAETINLLKKKAVGELNADQIECIDLAEKNQKRLAKLVDNVLDIVRLETGHLKIEIEKVFLSPFIDTLVKSFKPLFSKRELELVSNLDRDLPPVAADEDRLAQVIANLFNNAYKYTRDGKVEISAIRDGDVVRICVEDSGVGISKDNLERIFLKYEQLKRTDNIKPPEKGTGLGLYIAKNLVEAQDGRIWAESELGKGARFCFTVPIYKD